MSDQQHDQALQEPPATTTLWAAGHHRFPDHPGVLKVNLIVADIDRALTFYDRVFAMREVMRILIGGLVEVLVGDGRTTAVALIQLPQATAARGGPAMASVGFNAPFPLMTITVDDMAAACARVVEAGGKLLHPAGTPVQVGVDQTGLIAIVADLDGNSLELIELR